MLRALSFALLALLLLRALHPGVAAEATASARSATLARALATWTRQPPARAAVTLDSVPPPDARDWLAALRRAGVTLAWSGAAMPAAVAVTALPDPAGAWQVETAAPDGARLELRDALGALDTVSVRGAGAQLVVPRIDRGVVVRGAGGSAAAAARDSLVLRRVLVEGAASWETRFTVAALQERGWVVDAIEHVAPNVDVRVGAPAAADTARYAAVVAVDTSARSVAGAAAAFVRSGGGLVTLHDAATVGPAVAGAVLLEQRADGDVRAARFGAGRVLRVGIPDVWRMRMSADDSVADPVARHRAWLARAVASVAYAPRRVTSPTWPDDPAPFADLVARLGPARRLPATDAMPATALLGGIPGGIPDGILAALLAVSLLVEWLSRRLRGAR
jgi:hypothetical protein